jgi:hypothetical protein
VGAAAVVVGAAVVAAGAVAAAVAVEAAVVAAAPAVVAAAPIVRRRHSADRVAAEVVVVIGPAAVGAIGRAAAG